MADRISLTDFSGQIARCNAIRVASGLPPLDPDDAVKAAIRQWNRLLAEARTRLRETAGRDLAGNSFTYMIVSREAVPLFREYLASLTATAPPECDSGRR